MKRISRGVTVAHQQSLGRKQTRKKARRTAILLSLVAGAVVGGVQVVRMFRAHDAGVAISPSEGEQDDNAVAATVVSPNGSAVASASEKDATLERPVAQSAEYPLSEAPESEANVVAVKEAGSIEYAKELVSKLSQLDLSQGLSKEQAIELAQSFKQLAAQGTAALPAIREFLERNQDLSFNGVAGGNWIGYSSVRAGLLDDLLTIGGPEAVALSLRTLQTTADPTEVALLARNLEQMAPGQYREEALRATQETLEQVAKSKSGKWDVAPLFHLVEMYGDVNAVDDLAKRYPQWNYYSTMALASLPEGQGIPALAKTVQDPTMAQGGKSTVALQMLAQFSGQYPEAASTLIEQARSNMIPLNAWDQIAAGLGGDQYQFGSPLLDKNVPAEVESSLGVYQVHTNQNLYVHTPEGSIPGLKTYHVEDSNQNFYSVPIATDASADEIWKRLATINELVMANPNSPGIKALLGARDLLEQRLQK